MHYPCLSAGQYGCVEGSALMNLLVNEKVDLVLHGHEHTYQRGKQLATDPTTCPSISADGIQPGLRRRRRHRRHIPEGRRNGRRDRRDVRQEPLRVQQSRPRVAVLRQARQHDPRIHALRRDRRPARRIVRPRRRHVQRRLLDRRRRDGVGRSIAAVVPRGPRRRHVGAGQGVPLVGREHRRRGHPQLHRFARRRRDRHHDGDVVRRCVGHLGKHLHVLGHRIRHRVQPLDPGRSAVGADPDRPPR